MATDGLWTIHVNVPITRRKSFHLLENPEGEVWARDRHVGPLLDLLWSEEQRSCYVHSGQWRYRVDLLSRDQPEDTG